MSQDTFGYGLGKCQTLNSRMWRILSLALTVTVLLVPPAMGPFANGNHGAVAPAVMMSPGRVLFDESHTRNASSLWTPGNASIFGWILQESGYNTTTNFDRSLASGILNDYDVLALFFPMVPLSPAEVTAVHGFVANGGGLLLVGLDSVNAWGYGPSNLNPVSEPYGVTFNSDKVSAIVTDLADHPVTTDVGQLITRVGDLSGASLTVVSPAETVATYNGNPIIAVTDTGAGRVVCVGTLGPFMDYDRSTLGHIDDHTRFSLNVVDWLAHNPQRAPVLPDKAVIRVGPGADIPDAELDRYEAFVGLYHDHTTHSDGQNTVEQMLEKGLLVGLDFMTLTDHSYDKPAARGGVTGAQAARAIARKYDLYIQQFVGAELSSGRHTVGFPLQENVYTNVQQEMVDGIHAQGAIAVLAHPTLAPAYAEVYEAFDQYGYDAIEVDNSGYFHGCGEEGYFRNFLGASDGHSQQFVGKMLNVVFVRHPAGRHGLLDEWDFVDAVLNRRIVILDRVNNLVYGQGVWVDRWLEIWDEANSTVASARDQVTALAGSQDVGLAMEYVEAAETALRWWNPARALRLARNATSPLALGTSLSIESPSPRTVAPGSDFSLTLRVSNSMASAVTVNTTLFLFGTTSTTETYVEVDVAGSDTGSVAYPCHAGLAGYTEGWLTVTPMSSSGSLLPLLMRFGLLIDNRTVTFESTPDGVETVLTLQLHSSTMAYLKKAVITYDDGSGDTTVEMTRGRSYFSVRLGPYPVGTTITYTVTVTDSLGTTFELESGEITVEPPAGGADLTALLPYIVAGAVGLVAVVGIVLWLRRRG